MTIQIDTQTVTLPAPINIWLMPVTITFVIVPVLREVESTAEVLPIEGEGQS